MLELRNPHSVLAALSERPGDVREIRAVGSATGAWADVVARAVELRIPTRSGGGGNRGRSKKADGGREGASALIKPRPTTSAAELFADVNEKQHRVWLALDHLNDPHNVGAILRSAAFFGVRGVVLTKDRSAPLSATVYDVASGGVEYLPVAIETNLARVIDLAKQAGLWVLGTSERAEKDISEFSLDRSWLLAIGNEERGLRRLTIENCDELAAIKPLGPIESLNASTATAVLLSSLTGSS